MKKVLLLTLVLVLLVEAGCRNDTKIRSADSSAQQLAMAKPVIQFKEYEHDFGKVTEGEKISYTFTFENKGESDLIILSASTTCGCTVPKYDTKPIRSGQTGTIDIVFDTTGRSSKQTKTITVKSNASTPVVILKITAEVVENIN
jgi:hypothetical protein